VYRTLADNTMASRAIVNKLTPLLHKDSEYVAL
jgi:spore coat polysaccharide biosynthesis protein SpsF (cytidylyltransferase family)